MKIAYFDTIGGISGDMTLGACVAAGVPFDILNQELRKLQIADFELEARHIHCNGITATKIEVIVSAEQHHHRHLSDIVKIIQSSAFATPVQEKAIAIFTELARAEAAVHNTTIEKVHFHEVGAVDSIVDIVGTAFCLEYLGVQEVYSSPVKTGNGGFVQSEHGKLPIPTPATMELLKQYPLDLTPVPYELTTPTGAAILKTLSKGTLPHLSVRCVATGYGAGSRTIPELPNLLRLLLLETEQTYEYDEVLSIETNIDNMNPELYPYITERLFEAGALDVYLVPLIMKKGRPGTLLGALVPPSQKDAVLAVLFRETSTLGVRFHTVYRQKLPREMRSISTSLGTITVKVISIGGEEFFNVEYEECKRIAQERSLPLATVYRILQRELYS